MRAGCGLAMAASSWRKMSRVNAKSMRYWQGPRSSARRPKPTARTFWGGYNGYFADLDGHLWEIAYNPHWELHQQGRVKLPD